MIKFTPETWQRILGFEVIDPDGWNRHGDFETDWQTPLSFDQFMDKCDVSTCSQHYDREKLFQIAVNSIRPNVPNFNSAEEIRPSTNELNKTIRFKFIGHSPLKPVNKNDQFIVEITNEEFNRIKQFPFPEFMHCKIIDGKNCHKTGAEMRLLNPYSEFYKYHTPTFLRIE